MKAPIVYSQSTSSQKASAELHLSRRDEWRTVRIDSVRYVVLPSATSGRVYMVRADAAGCSCVYYLKTGRACAHMIAVGAANRITRQVGRRYEDLFPTCKTEGCQGDPEPREPYCRRHVLVDAF